MAWDRARFYTIGGKEYPSVTTALGIIDKSGPLMHWAANEERRHFSDAVLELVTRPDFKADPDTILEELAKAVSGVKASEKAKAKAGEIGTLVHAKIEYATHALMGERMGIRPTSPHAEIEDAATVAYMAWQDWAVQNGFKPLRAELSVYCECHGYAGTLDWIGHVRDELTLGDYKTGKAVYPESYLQNVAYRHAVRCCGMFEEEIEKGLILRLPKSLAEVGFDAVPVPENATLEDFLSALKLWRWNRRMNGLKVGVEP